MTIARKDIVNDDLEMTYLCDVRCVRRSFLSGKDTYSGKNFDHRKEWIADRVRFLIGSFSLEMLGYGIMDNHFHIMPRMLPDLAKAWDDETVARRYLRVFPPRPRHKKDDPLAKMEQAVQRLLRQTGKLAKYRRRLHSLSWFMRCLDEFIARKANKEDGCKGRFWEGRFHCQALLDQEAILAAMIYVDMNPVRADKARTPEDSEYTSARARIEERQAMEQAAILSAAEEPLGERAQAEMARIEEVLKSHDWLSPLTKGSDGRGVFSRLSLDEYLTILDRTGRVIRSDRRGTIPVELAPILERLAIRTGKWIESIAEYDRLFRRVLGREEDVRALARRAGRRWFQGVTACRALFAPPESTAGN